MAKFKTAVMPIIGANIIIFMIQLFTGGPNGWFTRDFLLYSPDVWTRPWILVTSMFLHASPTHLLFNMYVLFMFGPLIEQRIGKKRFAFIYFASGIIASFISTFFYTSALGASGAIMGILGVTIILMPDLPVLFFFVIPMSLRTAGIIFALVDIFGVFNPGGNIANIAHLVGLGCGLIYGRHLLGKRKAYVHRMKTARPAMKKKGKSYEESIEMTQEDIDDFLTNGRL